ncbi:MAG TPA: DNA/RNA non-specific endonuclease, partial [Propionibacteriaceae bacterium]
QTGPEVYARNDLDRGHLVRRRDPVWGPAQVAAAANFDSFSYVNAAPQAAQFNQGEFLWSGLEDYVLGHARMFGQRLSVFTAPILVPDDPAYRGVRIPRRFFKIAAWATPEQELACTGYLLDQTPQLEALDLRDGREAATEIPPLGAFLTFQVPVVDIATLTGLDLGPLPAADRLPTRTPVPVEQLSPAPTTPEMSWTLLHQLSDVQL